MRESGQIDCGRGANDDEAQLRLRGTVGILIADELRDASLEAAKAQTVTVDLSEAEHLDLAGWQVLISLKRTLEAQGGRLVVGTVPESMQRYVKASGLDAEIGGTGTEEA